VNVYLGCAGFSLKTPFKKRVTSLSSPILFFEIREIADLWEFSVPYDAPALKHSVKNSITLSHDGSKKFKFFFLQYIFHCCRDDLYCVIVESANEAIIISSDSCGTPLFRKASPIVSLQSI